MAQNSKKTIISRATDVVRLLHAQYKNPETALVYATPLQLLVATILSAQCTDKKVNEVTQRIFKKYTSAQDFARADRYVFEQEIRETGFYRNKAKHIIAAAAKLCNNFGGSVPETMEELISLPGVARKTANIVLSSAFNKAEGIAVDTHVKRLSQRLGLTRETNPDRIEKDLMAIIPKKDWLDVNYLLVQHGRTVCPARKPRCPSCVLIRLCPSAVP